MASKTFPGKFSSLGPISEFIAKEAKIAGLDDQEIYSVQLAVDEACTNIIEHAYEGEGRGDIVCICEAIPDGLEIELRDKGKPFDPGRIPDPEVGVPLESFGSRGAGVFLMKKLMDEVSYVFSEGGETILRMIKRR
jgi:serine/threonine-protein kinase RsbW